METYRELIRKYPQYKNDDPVFWEVAELMIERKKIPTGLEDVNQLFIGLNVQLPNKGLFTAAYFRERIGRLASGDVVHREPSIFSKYVNNFVELGNSLY